MSTPSLSQINDIPANLENAADTTHPEFPAQGDHGGLISGESTKQTFDLTPLEQHVITLAAEGFSGQEKASIMGISEQSLDAHLKAIFSKLGVSCEFELILFALHHRIISTYEVSEGSA